MSQTASRLGWGAAALKKRIRLLRPHNEATCWPWWWLKMLEDPGGRGVPDPATKLVKWLCHFILILTGLAGKRRSSDQSIDWSCQALVPAWLSRLYSLKCSCDKQVPEVEGQLPWNSKSWNHFTMCKQMSFHSFENKLTTNYWPLSLTLSLSLYIYIYKLADQRFPF